MKKPDFNVDLASLPQVLETLASETQEWDAALAEAQHQMYLADQKYNLAKARTEIEIRTNPLAFGNLKITEGAVAALVQIQPEVVEAERALIDAKLQVNSTRAVTNALDVKRSACKYLSELHLANKLV
jgi:lipopolysaccharide biosynthesis regulator YciM